jgi:hypothetical protein
LIGGSLVCLIHLIACVYLLVKAKPQSELKPLITNRLYPATLTLIGCVLAMIGGVVLGNLK